MNVDIRANINVNNYGIINTENNINNNININTDINENDDTNDNNTDNNIEDHAEFHRKNCHKYNYIPTNLPATRRIIALGDIHGDYKLCIKLLKIAKVIDEDLNWIGGDTIVVQVGDQIDRCRPYNGNTCNMKDTTVDDENSDIRILKYFTALDKMAQKNIPPGKVISLLGNHELLNTQGYFNYVSYKGIKKFNEYIDNEKPQLVFQSGEEARKYAFRPGNKYGKFLGCSRLGAVIIGSNLFVHAGLIDHFINEMGIEKSGDLDDINLKIKKWLLGIINQESIEKIISGDENYYSMFWNRILGKLPPNIKNTDKRCSDNITKVLKIFKINSMIIGHTPQSFFSNDKINGTCSNQVWRIDNGSSKAFDIFDDVYITSKKEYTDEARRPQVLEIINDNEFNVLFDTNDDKKYKKRYKS